MRSGVAILVFIVPALVAAKGEHVRTGRSSFRTPFGNIPIVVKLKNDPRLLADVNSSLTWGMQPIMGNVASTVANAPATTRTTLRAIEPLHLDSRAPLMLGGQRVPGSLTAGETEIIVQTRDATQAAALRAHLRGAEVDMTIGYAFDDAVRRALSDATERW